jgi:lipopolysaccharide/colanic/teichoic acid biosynthesis glycosyltransferase
VRFSALEAETKKKDNDAKGMTYVFKDPGDATVGTVLAFIDATVARSGTVAAVPTVDLPLLTQTAKCRPRRGGEGAGCFLFSNAGGQRIVCGIFERILASVALLVLSPLLFAVAFMIVLFDGFPVLFRQERYGMDGRPFTLFKFRTMLRHSEMLQEKLQQKLGENGRLFKLERDPRVTRLGGFLRRTFLDELPQLVNVVRGEMRWVGPRPLPASDDGHYVRPYHALRLKGLPGITGLWQVSGRNARTFDEMCLLDYYYLCNRSAALDALILGRTLCLVFKQTALKSEA